MILHHSGQKAPKNQLLIIYARIDLTSLSHPRFRPRLHDVYIVINRGEELKEKAPPSILLSMFRQ